MGIRERKHDIDYGFGNFCSAGSTSTKVEGTIGDERRVNDALTEPDPSRFVQRLVAGLIAYPAYYAHIGARNRGGPAPIDLSPPSR